MKQSIRKKIVKIILVFLLILTGIMIFAHIKYHENSYSEIYREQVLALNEIEQLTKTDNVSPAKDEITALEQDILNRSGGENTESFDQILGVLYVVGIFFVIGLFLYTYYTVLRPFEKLGKYAGEIAKGNMEVSLDYERSNFFGAFTWAFDHMRREILKARTCEKEAIENNKTVIATLSHDIKTPIASIRAYAEGLEANMDSTAERRQRYLAIIMKKCDEVTKLTNDLFIHSLSDLDKLQIQSEPMEISDVIRDTVEEMSGNRKDILIRGEIDKKCVIADRKRFEQVLENIINNARKYAPDKPMTLWTERKTSVYEIHIKDQGEGIPSEDLPFIFEKFYRGRNVGTEQGSGLGLYIVKYIMNQMNGEVLLKNHSDGLEVILQINEGITLFNT